MSRSSTVTSVPYASGAPSGLQPAMLGAPPVRPPTHSLVGAGGAGGPYGPAMGVSTAGVAFSGQSSYGIPVASPGMGAAGAAPPAGPALAGGAMSGWLAAPTTGVGRGFPAGAPPVAGMPGPHLVGSMPAGMFGAPYAEGMHVGAPGGAHVFRPGGSAELGVAAVHAQPLMMANAAAPPGNPAAQVWVASPAWEGGHQFTPPMMTAGYAPATVSAFPPMIRVGAFPNGAAGSGSPMFAFVTPAGAQVASSGVVSGAGPAARPPASSRNGVTGRRGKRGSRAGARRDADYKTAAAREAAAQEAAAAQRVSAEQARNRAALLEAQRTRAEEELKALRAQVDALPPSGHETKPPQPKQHRSAASSEFTGVHWHGQREVWKAMISVGGEMLYLGSFSREHERYAAAAFDAACISMLRDPPNGTSEAERIMCKVHRLSFPPDKLKKLEARIAAARRTAIERRDGWRRRKLAAETTTTDDTSTAQSGASQTSGNTGASRDTPTAVAGGGAATLSASGPEKRSSERQDEVAADESGGTPSSPSKPDGVQGGVKVSEAIDGASGGRSRATKRKHSESEGLGDVADPPESTASAIDIDSGETAAVENEQAPKRSRNPAGPV